MIPELRLHSINSVLNHGWIRILRVATLPEILPEIIPGHLDSCQNGRHRLDSVALLHLLPAPSTFHLLSTLFHKYGDVCGERNGVEFAKRRRRDVPVHRGGGATKKLAPSRRHPSG